MHTIFDGLEYNETVENKRLVFKGQKFEKVNSYIIAIIANSSIGAFIYLIIKSLINDNSSQLDYLVAIVFALSFILFSFMGWKLILTRDALKEIKTKLSVEETKIKLLEAARILNWDAQIIHDNYIIIKTKFGFVKDCQTVTLIFFPDNRVYFNSIDYPNNYNKPTRFMDNYKTLVDEYQKLENDEKLLVTNAIANAGMRVR